MNLEELEIKLGKISKPRERSEPLWENSDYASLMRKRYALVAELSKDKVVLDLCCGTGWGSRVLSQTARQVYGVDYNEDTIIYANLKHKQNNCQFSCMNALNLNFDNDFFDVVTACEVLEHFEFEEIKVVMDNIVRVLKSDGIFYGTTPLAPKSTSISGFLSTNKYHKYIFLFDELMEFLGKWFEEVRIDYIDKNSSRRFYHYFLCKYKRNR